MNDDRLDEELRRTLGQPGVHAIRDVLREVDAAWTPPIRKLDPKRPLRRSRWRVGLAAAASVLMLILAGTWLLGSDTTGVDSYLVPYEMAAAVRGDGDPAADAEARAYYEAGEYERAAAAFGTLSPDDPTVAFYRGVSTLLAGQAAEAIPILSALVARDDHLYVEQARYYLGLAYAKTGRDAEARSTLREIGEGQYRYREAQEMLALL